MRFARSIPATLAIVGCLPVTAAAGTPVLPTTRVAAISAGGAHPSAAGIAADPAFGGLATVMPSNPSLATIGSATPPPIGKHAALPAQGSSNAFTGDQPAGPFNNTALQRAGKSITVAAGDVVDLPAGDQAAGPAGVAAAPTAGNQTGPPDGDIELLPPDGVASGWQKAGKPRIFVGPELYGHIDGGAEAFLELGFEAVTVQSYTKDKAEIVVEIYRMKDEEAAVGIYLERCGPESRDSAIAERHTIGDRQLLLQRNQWYLVATVETGDRALRKALIEMGTAIARKVSANSGFDPAAKLLRTIVDCAPLPQPTTPVRVPGGSAFPGATGPGAEGTGSAAAGKSAGRPLESAESEARLVPGSIRVIRGPYALERIVTLGEGDVLQLKGRVTTVAGDFRTTRGAACTILIADYPSPDAASAAFSNLRNHLDPEWKIVSREETLFVFRDHDGRFSRASRTGATLTIQLGVTPPAPALPSDPAPRPH